MLTVWGVRSERAKRSSLAEAPLWIRGDEFKSKKYFEIEFVFSGLQSIKHTIFWVMKMFIKVSKTQSEELFLFSFGFAL